MVEISFPLEFWLEGVPVSLQASARSKEFWKGRVSAAAENALAKGHGATHGPVGVTIYYFPDARMEGDLDNILKPILDALGQVVYVDDQQVERIVVQKFEPGGASGFVDPSSVLIEAMEAAGPRVYLRIDSDAVRGDE